MGFRPLGNERFTILQNGMVSDHQIHVKTAFIHLSVWLIGESGKKLRCRPRFNSWQFESQAELRKNVVGQEIANVQIWDFLKNLKFLIPF